MAKQSGIHQLKGKIRGMSYYNQKGVSEGLARSINQGLSKRVKEDVAYHNTRLNATEFGRAGSFAGACIRAISDRQRTMLKDFATGMLAKQVRDIIVSDLANNWGNRQLEATGWQNVLMGIINTYAKVDFLSNVGGVWDVVVNTAASPQQFTPNAELPTGWGASLAAKGATGAYVDMYYYNSELKNLGNDILKGVSAAHLIASGDTTIGTSLTLTTQAEVDADVPTGDEVNRLDCTLVVVRPYQMVNGEKFIRQELCTFILVPFTAREN